ncbi:unnamed protein product [Darwinula stevensoni]|uniref:Phospholipid/glycerol acyltransferase domain-containing protein n=1 Tax=Darwinula stevensoni TaxID=69355 RepID=A0A7R9A553_9CRUS|nr:unnamed protein product [Darwinula stevensoni]CAG0885713.1 unnamed protein product [Darwinula stevensoni]
MGSLCKCVLETRTGDIDEKIKCYGLKNMLQVPTENQDVWFFKRWTCYLSFIWNLPITQQYQDIPEEIVLQTLEKEAAICLAAQDESQRTRVEVNHLEDFESVERERADTMLSTMAAQINMRLARFLLYVGYKILTCLFSTVQVHEGQLETLKQISETPHPVIYVPLHKSYMDYILISFILLSRGMHVPMVAAEENMNIAVIGPLLKQFGVFFVRQKMQKDHMYRCILQAYIEQLLVKGHYLEFFIEGARSQTGKPKRGILSIIASAQRKGLIEDAWIVPVGISYEKLVEGEYVWENLGRPKIPESFLGTLQGILRIMTSSYGNIRVDFGQPCLLKDFGEGRFHQSVIKPHPNSHSSINELQSSQMDSETIPLLENSPSLKKLSEGSSMCPLQSPQDDTFHQFVRHVSVHIAYDSMRCCAVMSTQVLSLVFLTLLRRGGTICVLAKEFEYIVDAIKARHFDVGFTGQTRDIIMYAAELLGSDLVHIERHKPKTFFLMKASRDLLDFYKPNLLTKGALALSYYANMAAIPFHQDAIVATAIWSYFGSSFRVFMEQQHGEEGAEDMGTPLLRIGRQALHNRVEQLQELLQYEILFAPPCIGSEFVAEVIEGMCSAQILRRGGWIDVRPSEARWMQDLAEDIAIDSHENELVGDEELQTATFDPNKAKD